MPTKIWERHLTEANGNPLAVLAAERPSKTFAVEMPHEFLIKKLVVTLASGACTNFDVTLYNLSPVSLDPVGDMSESLGATPNPVIAQVGDVMSATGDPPIVQYFSDSGIPFRNMEGSQSVPVKRIFVQISNIAGGSGDLEFDLAIGGEPVVAF
jgi:hypothetical protein